MKVSTLIWPRLVYIYICIQQSWLFRYLVPFKSISKCIFSGGIEDERSHSILENQAFYFEDTPDLYKFEGFLKEEIRDTTGQYKHPE